MSFKHPANGNLFHLSRPGFINVTPSTFSDYCMAYTKNINGVNCIIFKDKNNNKYYQSMTFIKRFWSRPGEDNCSAKITNDQAKDIFVRANNGEDINILAAEFGLTTSSILDIKNLRSWKSIILGIASSKKIVTAKENLGITKNRKLNAKLACFMVKDNKNGIPVPALAKKYCGTDSTVRRILNGKMWAQATVNERSNGLLSS